MSIRTKALAAAAALALISGTGAVATSAWASSPGCAFSNGCATLHGTDAAGNDVAMDAKYQNKSEILIGYVDNAGDGATSFDGVLHYGKGAKTTSYADTGFTLSPTFTSIPCDLTTDHAVSPTQATPDGPITAGGNILTVESTTLTATASPTSGASLTLGGAGTVTVDEQYASDGTSCEAAYTGTVGAGPTWTGVTAANKASLTFPTSPGGSTWTFLDSDSGGTFKFSGLPAGVSVSGGSLTADTSTAVPGTYTNVGVTYTATDGAVFTATFTLKVSGIKSTTPGVGVPYYTFVYAPKGDWTSQCVTDINGSGALKLFPCTLGKDTGQDFTINSASGLLDGSQYHVSNWLAAAAGAKSCMTDPSTSAAATPQSDAADELAPGGRQLYVNGSCAANTNLWSWGT